MRMKASNSNRTKEFPKLLLSHIDHTGICMDSAKHKHGLPHTDIPLCVNTELVESFTMRNRPAGRWRASAVGGYGPNSPRTRLEYSVTFVYIILI